MDLGQYLEVLVRDASENAAHVAIRAVPRSDSDTAGVVSLSAAVYGPRCAYARTLPTTYALSRSDTGEGSQIVVEGVIPEPCFWTSELPFLYDGQVSAKLSDGSLRTWSQSFGIRRLDVQGPNILIERKRSVLRGVLRDNAVDADLAAARESEAAILVRAPNLAYLQRASELGVAVIADLRGRGDLLHYFVALSWQPAVTLVLVDDGDALASRPVSALTCLAIKASAASPPDLAEQAHAFAIELEPGMRPPHWVSHCGKPVIAIRRGTPYAEFHEARAACDRLQAGLAPEFDLAGYFVGA